MTLGRTGDYVRRTYATEDLEAGNAARRRLYTEISLLEGANVNPDALSQIAGEWRARVAHDFEWDVERRQLVPRFYDEDDGNCPPVRLVVCPVIFFRAETQKLLELAKWFVECMGGERAVYTNGVETWHVSVFHFSRSFARRPLPLQKALDEVKSLHAAILSADIHDIQLTLADLVLDRNGNLLVLFEDQDDDSGIDGLRRLLAQAFPDAPREQTRVIIHLTLCRVVNASLVAPDWDCLQQRLQTAKRELIGTVVSVKELWYLQTKWMWSVEGSRTIFPMRTDTNLSLSLQDFVPTCR